LDVVVGHPIAHHDRGKVDLDKISIGRKRNLLVLGVDDVRNVRNIGAAITLGGEMERLSGVFGEAAEEEFHEGINILSSNRARVDGTAIFRVRIPNVDGLVEENHVRVGVPAVGVNRRVGAFVGNVTRTKLEQKASRRATSWAAVEPHHKGRIFRRSA
jgi:hypothetical protein